MQDSYIPRREQEALGWMKQFAGGLETDPAMYGVGETEITVLAEAIRAYESSIDAAQDPYTRSRNTTAAKTAARGDAEKLCRRLAMRIKADDRVRDHDKLRIGVRPRKPLRRRIPCPQTSPLLSLLWITAGAHRLRYADSTTPDSTAKPPGAKGLQLFIAVGETEAAPLAEARMIGTYTRSPMVVTFDTAYDGKIATYYARWAGARGAVGPWSLPVSMRITA